MDNVLGFQKHEKKGLPEKNIHLPYMATRFKSYLFPVNENTNAGISIQNREITNAEATTLHEILSNEGTPILESQMHTTETNWVEESTQMKDSKYIALVSTAQNKFTKKKV